MATASYTNFYFGDSEEDYGYGSATIDVQSLLAGSPYADYTLTVNSVTVTATGDTLDPGDTATLTVSLTATSPDGLTTIQLSYTQTVTFMGETADGMVLVGAEGDSATAYVTETDAGGEVTGESSFDVDLAGYVVVANSAYADGTEVGVTYAALVLCFAEGTRIATPAGEMAVESLQPGDLVLTAAGDTVPVTWIGRRSVATLFGPAERVCPVVIAAGALGQGLPRADLTVTADHGIVLDGYVVHAAALVDGAGIRRLPKAALPGRVTYWHVETAGQQVVLANGQPAETFVDHASRRGFDNYAEYRARFGDEVPVAALDLPRVLGPRQLPAVIRARLAAARAARVA